MSRPKKMTAPSKMSTSALIAEHRQCADDCECALKARRLALKDQIVDRAVNKGDQDAIDYMSERRWPVAAPA